MKTLLRLFVMFVLCTSTTGGGFTNFASAHPSNGCFGKASTSSANSVASATYQPIAFSSVNGTGIYGNTSQLFSGSYTVPLAARSVSSGTTLASGSKPDGIGTRNALGGGGDSYRPDYDLEDPFHTPVGDLPLAWMAFLTALVAFFRYRSSPSLQNKIPQSY